MMDGLVLIRKLYSLSVLVLAVLVSSACTTPGPAAPVQDGSGVAPPPPDTAAATAKTARFHVVKPGETLSGIARQYGVLMRDLVTWNRLSNPDHLYVGQELWTSAPDAAVGSSAVATPIPLQPEGKVTAVTPVTPIESGDSATKQGPIGGKQPYSEEAWAKARPSTAAPAAQDTAAAASSPLPKLAPGSQTAWLWPAKGAVLAGFSEASNKGIDIAGAPGDPVVAAAAGKVAYSGGGLRGYGKLVIIRHDADFLTAYAHNQNLLVKEGEMVQQGQKIAEMGSTDTDRPKLHFEIRKQGRPVDPMQYLPAR